MPILILTPAPLGWRVSLTPSSISAGRIVKDNDTPWDQTTLADRYTSLLEWANENSLQLEPRGYTPVSYNEWSELFLWSDFQIRQATTPNNEQIIGPYQCTGCLGQVQVGQMFCPSCDTFVVCSSCFIGGTRLHGMPGQPGGACTKCCIECTSCHGLMPSQQGFDRCSTCDPRGSCGRCTRVLPMEQLRQHQDTQAHRDWLICSECEAYVCQGCTTVNNNVRAVNVGNTPRRLCQECAAAIYDQDRQALEAWPTEELPVSGAIIIPSTPSRPCRTISIETEFDGDGAAVGRALHKAKLTEGRDRDRYSTQGDAARSYPCILKSDGTVTGGELVSFLLDLDNENHAAALMRMTEVMRGCREMGMAEFSHRAGGHIHIDLHDFGIADLWALYTVFRHLEKPLYYLAGAGASYGHRSLSGSNYGNPPNLGPFGDKRMFLQKLRNEEGRSGINFGNILRSLHSCKCGAHATGEWEICKCNLGKATAEWRLWNAEITPRILHGWIAVMQAMTSWAQEIGDDFKEEDYPYLPWTRSSFSNLNTDVKNQIKDRLQWMHSELPLTLHERDSFIYACKRSQLIGLGDTFLDSLLDIEPNHEFAEKKKPRSPSSRRQVKFDFETVAG